MTIPTSPILAAALASVPRIRGRIIRVRTYRGPIVVRVYYGVRIPIREYRDQRKDRT